MPATAVRMMPTHTAQLAASFSRPISVRKPGVGEEDRQQEDRAQALEPLAQLLAKLLAGRHDRAGEKRPEERVDADDFGQERRGQQHDEHVRRPSARRAGRVTSSNSRPSHGLTTHTMTAMKMASAHTMNASVPPMPPAVTSVTTIASSDHAVTSSTAAQARAVVPSGVRVRARAPR